MNSQSLIGVNMLRIADHRPDVLQTCLQEVYKLFSEGKIDPLVGAEFKSEQLAVAHTTFEKGETIGKIAIHF